MDPNDVPTPNEECRNGTCKHALEQHISHLNSISDEQISEMLGAIVDTENLYISMHNEKDDDTKRIYYYLFRVSFFFSRCLPQRWNRRNSLSLAKSLRSSSSKYAAVARMFIESAAARNKGATWRSSIRVTVYCESDNKLRLSEV